MQTIEEKLQLAMTKNPLTRNRLVLEALDNDIKKAVYILVKKIRRKTRIYDIEDLVQEACISIIMALNNNYADGIKCQLRTYLIGAVKRTVWGILRKEARIKRQAQNNALPIELLENPILHANSEPKYKLMNNNVVDVATNTIIKDAIVRIKEQLPVPADEIFMAIMDGYTVKEISDMYTIKLQTVYTIIRTRIKPVAKRVLEV